MKLTRRQVLAALAVLAGWTIIALLFTSQHYALSRDSARAPHWSRLLYGNLITFWSWAALTPAAMWIGRRFPLERRRVARHLAYYVVGIVALSLAHITLVRYLNMTIFSRTAPWTNVVISMGATSVLISVGLLAASQAVIYFRRFQDRELRLAQVQLQSLKSQLHPHFLFNTLNAIAELVHSDTARAERTVTQLSGLLRTALSREGAEQVTLKEELAFLHNYLDIQQTLLQERLVTRWRVDDDTLDARVPAMLLQPVVENAIQHGIAPVAAGGTLEISARRDGDRLVLEVRDDGRGIGSSAGKGGIGLSNTRARLRHLYGDAHAFTIGAGYEGGTDARFEIPLQFEGSGVRGSEVPGEETD
jgi:two-component system LytT family sensor kinase